MNKTQYLLCKLAEEASEVAQIALKAQQFGLDEVYPKVGLRNSERLTQELNDLMASITMLVEAGYVYQPDDIAIQKKYEKVEKYMEYSQRLGMVAIED